MKSSDPAGGAAGIFYSVLAVLLPLVFLAALTLSAAALGRFWLPGSPLSPAALLLPAGLSALLASLYYSLMKDDREDHTAGAIRGGIIVMALAYPAASLLRGELALSLRFLPGPANLLAPLGALAAWTGTLSLKRLFRERERLESYTGTWRGEKLQERILEDAALFQALFELSRKNRRLLLTQLLLLYALALARLILGLPLPVPEFILLGFCLFSGLCFCALLEFFREEHFYAGEGMAAPASSRLKRIAGMGVFTLAAALGGLLLAPGRSILPLSLITGLFARLAALFTQKPRPQAAFAPPPRELFEREPPPLDGLGGLIGAAEEALPWPFWEWLQYGAVALGAFLFIRFMLKPLFDRSRIGGPLRERLRRLAAQWFRGLRAALALFIAALRGEGVRSATLNPEALRRAAGDLLAAYSSRKRRELRASLTLFARLIVWGSERLGVSWKPSLGPGEYCALLKTALLAGGARAELVEAEQARIQTARAVVRCGELFEQALYAPEPLNAGEHREFKRLIGEITR
jgi:hypothetical protein